MEYKIIYISMSQKETEELLNTWASQGWRVVAFSEDRVILAKELPIEIKTRVGES